MQTYTTVDAYIAHQSADIRPILTRIRSLVREIAPDAVESVSYGMPAYKYMSKPLFYFAAFAHHIGIYPTPGGIEAFVDELASYKQGKGSIQLPLDAPIPYDLIGRIVRSRMSMISDHHTRPVRSSSISV